MSTYKRARIEADTDDAPPAKIPRTHTELNGENVQFEAMHKQLYSDVEGLIGQLCKTISLSSKHQIFIL